MAERIKIRPVAGLSVPLPEPGPDGTTVLAPNRDTTVPRSRYWLRRLAAGEVVIANPKSKKD